DSITTKKGCQQRKSRNFSAILTSFCRGERLPCHREPNGLRVAGDLELDRSRATLPSKIGFGNETGRSLGNLPVRAANVVGDFAGCSAQSRTSNVTALGTCVCRSWNRCTRTKFLRTDRCRSGRRVQKTE